MKFSYGLRLCDMQFFAGGGGGKHSSKVKKP